MNGRHCNTTLTQLVGKLAVPLDADLNGNVSRLCDVAFKADINDEFSKPLVWIGMYIASGSALCVVAMLADLLFAQNILRQIPYKRFSLNAATITVLSIAVKLPLDMTGEMPGFLDQATKLGSLVFMCTILLANLIPNLASMDNKTLVSNLVAVAILVITISVNILIAMYTGVIDPKSLDELLTFGDAKYKSGKMRFDKDNYFVQIAIFYVVSMLFLLLVSISAAVSLPSMKKVLEHKYQVRLKALRKEPAAKPTTLVELEKQVTKYWIMAKTGSPQIVLTASPLFLTSWIICITSTGTYIAVLVKLKYAKNPNFGSDYKWSMAVILMTQFIGIIVGDCTLLLRYFNTVRIRPNSYDNLRVDKYWYARLCEWKGRHIAFLEGGHRRSRSFFHTLKNSFLNICIVLQIVLLFICKSLELGFLYVITHMTRIVSVEDHEDLRANVLRVEDKVEIDQYALHSLMKFKNRLVQKAERKENSNLLELLGKSNGFKEGKSFEPGNIQIPPSVTLESWSLPVVTLTCITMVVQDSQDQIDGLIKSVDQALVYAYLVEENFNSEQEYANMHKTTMDVWCEVKDACKWLKTSLRRNAFQEKTPTQILKWFDDTAGAIVTRKSNVEPWENYPDYKLICKSMQSISRSILSKYQNGTELSTKVEFSKLLSSTIADILFACLSNIPQVITRKCHVEKIEKREASVEDAVKILARTTKILEMLKTPKLPILDPDEMKHKLEPTDEWRRPLIQPELSAV